LNQFDGSGNLGCRFQEGLGRAFSIGYLFTSFFETCFCCTVLMILFTLFSGQKVASYTPLSPVSVFSTCAYAKQAWQFLVGGLEHFLCFHILGRIIPTDELIFFRGVETTNQIPNMINMRNSHVPASPPLWSPGVGWRRRIWRETMWMVRNLMMPSRKNACAEYPHHPENRRCIGMLSWFSCWFCFLRDPAKIEPGAYQANMRESTQISLKNWRSLAIPVEACSCDFVPKINDYHVIC
jgi:hypothetical protein